MVKQLGNWIVYKMFFFHVEFQFQLHFAWQLQLLLSPSDEFINNPLFLPHMFGLDADTKTELIGIDFSIFSRFKIRLRFYSLFFLPTIPNFTRCYINMSARLQKIKATNRFSVRGVLDCSFFFRSSPLAQNKLQRIVQERNRFRRSPPLTSTLRMFTNWATDDSTRLFFLCYVFSAHLFSK